MVATLLLVVVAWWSAPAQVSNEFVGVLDAEAVPGPDLIGAYMPAVLADADSLGGLAPKGSRIGTASLPFPREPRIPLYVIETAPTMFFVLADFNQDGVLAADERIRIPAGADAPAVVVQDTMRRGALPSIPVAFRDPQRSPPLRPEFSESFRLKFSNEVLLRGTVPVAGRPVAFALAVNPEDGQVRADRDLQYVDTNRDGRLDRDVRSWERAEGLGYPTVFRVDESYLSVKAIDLPARRVTFAPRTAEDYERIELRIGAVMPDFRFVDLAGRPRRLAEFRGKFTLIDFWGTWCPPCVAHTPVLKEAYAKYRSQGFEILGINHETPDETPEDLAEGLDRLVRFVNDRGVTWTQARTSSIKDLSDRQVRVGVWPTLILLDREGRIVSVDRVADGQLPLRGERLLETLAAVIRPPTDR